MGSLLQGSSQARSSSSQQQFWTVVNADMLWSPHGMQPVHDDICQSLLIITAGGKPQGQLLRIVLRVQALLAMQWRPLHVFCLNYLQHGHVLPAGIYDCSVWFAADSRTFSCCYMRMVCFVPANSRELIIWGIHPDCLRSAITCVSVPTSWTGQNHFFNICKPL